MNTDFIIAAIQIIFYAIAAIFVAALYSLLRAVKRRTRATLDRA